MDAGSDVIPALVLKTMSSGRAGSCCNPMANFDNSNRSILIDAARRIPKEDHGVVQQIEGFSRTGGIGCLGIKSLELKKVSSL